jgi:hypothetical protein
MNLSLFPSFDTNCLALKNCYHLSNKSQSICLSKGSVSFAFDRVIRTANVSVSRIKLLVNEPPVVYNSLSGTFMEIKLILMSFTRFLGHCSSDRLEKTAKIKI